MASTVARCIVSLGSKKKAKVLKLVDLVLVNRVRARVRGREG